MNPIPVLKPLLPLASEVVQYIKLIDNNRWYTNFGPLTASFEERLASLFKVETQNLVTVSNGTLALTLGLKSLRKSINKKICIMPAWTFVATAHAAILAGLEPVFCDVDIDSWAISPEIILKTIQSLNIKYEDVHSVILVAPFGMPFDIYKWESFKQNTGIEILVDAAASFDTLSYLNKFKATSIPVMISMHATKVFGIGEGAILISNDREYILEVRKRSNFGFWGSREAQVIGTNAKLSEYSSAIGLAELDNWQTKRSAWELCATNYLQHEQSLNLKGIYFLKNFGEGWVSSYCIIMCASNTIKNEIVKNLKNSSIDTRDWWGDGVHTHPAFEHYRRTVLPNTRTLCSLSLGLPFFTDLNSEDIYRVINVCLDSVK